MKTIVVIPCGGKKLTEPAPAAELYTGSMFKDQLRTALTMTERDNVFILSALHGLISLDTVLEPYDVTFGSGNEITSVANQLENITGGPFNNNIRIEALLPKKYAALLNAGRGFYPITNHFAGTKGIGYQKAVLAQLRSAA